MAIALKGTPILAGATSSGTGTLSIDVSSLSLASGDCVLVCIGTASQTSDKAAPSLSGNATGSFGTADADLYANGSTRDSNVWSFCAALTGSDTTLSLSGLPGSSGHEYAVVAYTGVDGTTQRDVTPTTATGISTDRADPAAITPTTTGAKIVAFYFGAQRTSTAWTAPTGVSDFSQASTAIANGRVGFGDADWTSGAFDPAAVTGGENSSFDSWAAITYALRPASGGGGTTYNDSVSESVTSAVSNSTAAVFGSTLSETATAGDITASTAVMGNALNEAVAAGDVVTGALLLTASLNEGITAADAPSTLVTWQPVLAESVTGSDSVVAAAVMVGTISESVTAAFTASSGSTTYNDTLSEAVSLTDAVASTQLANVTLAEGVVSGDASTAGLVISKALTENASAGDASSATAIFAPALAETVAASDSEQAIAAFSEILAETFGLGDSYSSTGGTNNHEQYPLAGIPQPRPNKDAVATYPRAAQTFPLTASLTYPRATQRYPLEPA